jgi:hypothetical protein
MQDQHSPVTQKKSVLRTLWTGVFTLMYPFILLFSLAFIGIIHVFSLLSRLISLMIPAKQETEGSPKPTWSPFAKVGNLRIESKFVDEVMFGPSYYKLKANQAIQEFSDHYFGDFQLPFQDGILLQKWHDVTNKQLPDFDLVFLNAKTGTLHHLKTIRSFTWKVEQEKDKIILWLDEKKEEGKLIIRVADLQFNSYLK